MRYCLAIDIGASSGRHIAGWKTEQGIQTRELYRFPNGVHEEKGHLVWDIEALVFHVKEGIRIARAEMGVPSSLSVDTWGVDYVLLRDEEPILPVYAYRDSRTEAVIPKVHEQMPFRELYRRTGCQFQPFNTVYQLYNDLQQGRLAEAADLLMMPEYLMYRLCGGKAREFTNATTTGLVNAQTGEYDNDILATLGYPARLFPKLTQPGKVLGSYEGIPVVLCATHDTASAVEGIPMQEDAPYISSGTWSLLGAKTPKPITGEESFAANYSNEGGVGYNRYQKNIMGMWLINELRRSLCPDAPFSQIVQWARESSCDTLVDANAPQFLAPKDMRAAFDEAAPGAFREPGDYFRCAYRSLAQSYAKALQELEANTGTHWDSLYIVGGGAKNQYLNDLTARAAGKQVIALPLEATALGNLKIQMEAMGI